MSHARPTPISIENCVDFNTIREIMDAAGGAAWSDRSLSDELAHSRSRSWIARAPGGESLGFLFLRLGVDVAEIRLVGVVPLARRRGVGAALVGHAVEEARRAGLAEVQLELRASNTTAQRLYDRTGFVVVGSRARYYADGEDAILMTRHASDTTAPATSGGR